MDAAPLEGECAARFRPLRAAFAENFRSRGELGAALCVVQDGERVVDLWGGHQDEARSVPWCEDTLVSVFSISKGLTSLCTALLLDRGLLDPDAPVASYWTEFGAQGKQHLTVSEALSHRAGLPSFHERLPVDAHVDWAFMTQRLAAERPWWKPGSRMGYHARTWGWLAGEILRRIDGRLPGDFLRDEITAPLGLASEIFLGTPEAFDPRVAKMAQGNGGLPLASLAFWLRTPWWMPMRLRVFENPPEQAARLDSRAWRAAQIPAANGIASARGLATLFGALARTGAPGDPCLIRPAALERATRTHAEGRDLVYGFRQRFGLGFMLDSTQIGLSAAARGFGHTGAGGSFAFADPDRRLGIAYVMNRVHAQKALLVDSAQALVRGLHASLAA